MHKSKGWKIVSIVILLLTFIFVTIPLYWVVSVALRPSSNLFTMRIIPSNITLKNFEDLLTSNNWGGFQSVSFIVPLKNSIIVASLATLIGVTLSIFAGYGLARIKFKRKSLMSGFILFSYTLPPFVLVIALYDILTSVNLINSLAGLILVYMLIVVPYSTWTLKGYFSGIPRELEDAARVDGASRIGTLFRVILPSAAPGVASVAIFSFTLSWGELLFAMTFLNSYNKFTLAVALRTMVVGDFLNWGNLMAGVIISMLPPLVLYLILQKFVVQGLTAGAIK